MTATATSVSRKLASEPSTWSRRANVRRVRKLDRETRQTNGYNIFRWYRSGWGRYTQGDPIGLEGGANLYTHANNNPPVFVDPGGLSSIAVARALGGALVETIIIAGIVAGGWAQGVSQADVDAKIQARTQKKCQCSEETKKRLDDEVDKQCHVGQRSCDKVRDLATLQANRAQNMRCAVARQMINVQCFDGGDNRHVKALGEALRAIRTCNDQLEKLMKRTAHGL